MIGRTAVALAALTYFHVAAAGSWREEFEARKTRVDEVCSRAGKPAFRAEDRPTDAEVQALGAGCDSEALYYGMGVSADPGAARKCAFAELAAGDFHEFGGSRVLMMVYANGAGVTRDLDVAIAIACEMEAAPAERVGRVSHLLRMKASDDPGRFDLCDDITSGYMQGFCARNAARSAAVEGARRLGAAAARVPDRARPAFQNLRAAAEGFFSARASNEVDLSGTGRAAFVIEEQMRLEREFIDAVEALVAAPLPEQATAADFIIADRELNQAYRAVGKQGALFGTLTPDGVRSAQRSWIGYRDAWVAFGRALYPQVPESAWKTWVTRQRTKMLDDLAQ